MMTKQQRVQAALKGEAVDRVPVAFWRHWPVDDQDAAALAGAALEYQRRFDWDLIKVPPSHSYCIEDYGGSHAYRGRGVGDRDWIERAIKRPDDWDHIAPLDVTKGAYGRTLECQKRILDGREAETPVIMTIFNPIGMARFLAGDETFRVHLRRYPERVERALAALTETCAAFARLAVAEGADGIFLSTANATYEDLSEDEYRRYGRPGDLRVLAAAAQGWFNVLHLHGQQPMFASVADYPVAAFNWHDRTTELGLREGLRQFPGAVMGGVEQYEVLHFATPNAVQAQVRDAIAQTGGRRLIVAAGCTYPVGVPEGNLRAARAAVEQPRAGA